MNYVLNIFKCEVMFTSDMYCITHLCSNNRIPTVVPVPCPKGALYLQVIMYEFLLVLKLELLVFSYFPVAKIGIPYFIIDILQNVIPCNLVCR
jgi:hypothetical protein